MQRLNDVLARVVTVDINDPLVIDAYAHLDVFSRSIGRQMGKNDLWIAAVARVTRATLLTTDGDFDCLADTHIQRRRIDANTGKTL